MAKVKILRRTFTEENVTLTFKFDYGMTVGLSFPKTATKEEIFRKVAEEYVKNAPPEWMLAYLNEGEEIDLSEYVRLIKISEVK